MSNTIGSGTINHDGIVQKNDEESVTVSIISSTACSGCHAEGSCSMSGKEEKIIEVHGKYNVSAGDRVVVLMKQSMGFTALFLGYLLPLLIVIITLIILISIKTPELTAGLTSLAVLIPYYSVLWVLRNRINEKFTFTLKA